MFFYQRDLRNLREVIGQTIHFPADKDDFTDVFISGLCAICGKS